MWVEAFDLLLKRLHEKGLPLAEVVAVSASGQQHGSVYWKVFIDTIRPAIFSKALLTRMEHTTC
jgi:sugar (pentulose or hexulose) kinase